MLRIRHLVPVLLAAAVLGGAAPARGAAEPGSPELDPRRPASVPVTVAPTGHLLVRPVLDGREVGAFVLDTGATVHLIDPQALERVALRAAPGRLSQDIGGRVVRNRVWRAEEMRLGPASWARPEFLEHDLRGLSRSLGVEIAGILGHDLFPGVVAEIDFAAGSLALHDPARFRLGAQDWSELRLVDGLPQTRARFEGRDDWFVIDTGAAADTVTFHAPAVRRHELLDGRRTRPRWVAGASGTVELRAGRLSDFELAGHRFERPRAAFAGVRRGPLASRSAAGTIGGAFLRPFRLFLDYGAGRAAFAPIPQ